MAKSEKPKLRGADLEQPVISIVFSAPGEVGAAISEARKANAARLRAERRRVLGQ